jgi:hypothetical protein
VDAAHILPWYAYDLDLVSNGVCLCKIHHWAFDEGLIQIRFENGVYFVDIPESIADRLAVENPSFSLDRLREYIGPIPESRLPADPKQRPDPRFLERLSEYG